MPPFDLKELGLAGAVATALYFVFRLYVAAVTRQLADKDTTIAKLEVEKAKWEQRAIQGYEIAQKAAEVAQKSAEVVQQVVAK